MYADKVLVNKIDLLKEEQRQASLDFISNCVRKVNAEALIEATSFAKVDLEQFLSQLEEVRAKKKKILSRFIL